MKISLTLRERILLLSILPKGEGSLLMQRVLRELKGKLGVSDEDWKTYDIEQLPDVPGAVKWNLEKDKGVDFELGDKSIEIIKEALRELDKQKKVTEDFLSLYDKILPTEDAA